MKRSIRLHALLCALAFSALTFAPAANAQELIVNGSFETGSFAPWTLGWGNTSVVGSDSLFAHTGTHNAFLEDSGGIGTLSQTFNTVIGQQYTISFWYANDELDTNNMFAAFFNGVQGFSASNVPIIGYTNVTFNAVATTATSTLQFQFRHDVDFFRLDTVSVVPEPSTNVLLILSGAGLLGLVQYRRVKARRATAVS